MPAWLLVGLRSRVHLRAGQLSAGDRGGPAALWQEDSYHCPAYNRHPDISWRHSRCSLHQKAQAEEPAEDGVICLRQVKDGCNWRLTVAQVSGKRDLMLCKL